MRSLIDILHLTPVATLINVHDTLIFKVLNISKPVERHVDWVEDLKPGLEFLITLISAFTLVWKYLTQRGKELEEQIIENKRKAYDEFLQNFTNTAVKVMYDKDTEGIKHDRERMYARNQLLLYANDKVIQAYHNWIEESDSNEHNIDTEVELFGKILLAIRNDLHGKSKVTAEQISNLNPFNRG